MKKKIPFLKKKVSISNPPISWFYGKKGTNIVLENPELNVKFLKYFVESEKGKTLYEAISIKESPKNSVVIVRNHQKELGLVWEWRPIPAKWFWACVRGFGDPKDKNGIDTAKREMIEEIGNCKIIGSERIGSLYQNTTFFENPVGLFLLDVEVIKARANKKEGILKIKFFSPEKVMKMINDEEIMDTFTLSALMKYFTL